MNSILMEKKGTIMKVIFCGNVTYTFDHLNTIQFKKANAFLKYDTI